MALKAIFAGVFGLALATGNSLAFECPQHIEAAEQQINKVMEDMKGMGAMMSQEDMMLVHTLIDDAKMLLESARHNHEKPQGAFDHARSIAKSDAAKGFAIAADILHFNQMQALEKSLGTESMQDSGEMQPEHDTGDMPKD